MNRSLRLRLTLLYSGLFAILLLAAAVFVYKAMARVLNERMDQTLAAEADTAAGLLADEYTELGHKAEPAAREVVQDMKLRGDLLSVTESGRVLAASPPERGGETRRRNAERIVLLDDAPYLVTVSASMEPVESALDGLRRTLGLGLPVALLLTSAGAWIVAGRALRPLASVAAQARAITEHTLHTRIQAAGAASELESVIGALNDLLGRLDSSFDALRRFVADASHELRTPISIIRGEAEVTLSRERSPAEYREALALVHDESRRLTTLVNDLLDLARADSGRVRLDLRTFYLNDLLAECCRSYRTLAAAKGLQLDVAPAPDLEYRGDEQLLRRLILNLLDNALCYTPDGGRITVSLEVDDSAARLRVADTGIGIAPEHTARVFERFYRTDEARTRTAGGFGLGLSIVQWIAEAHRGEVACVSHPGAGARFEVTLPLPGALGLS